MIFDRMTSMKVVLPLLGIFMAVYVCQFSAQDYDDEEAAILVELEDSVLEDVDLDSLFDDSDGLLKKTKSRE